jgi:hypothetical protein
MMQESSTMTHRYALAAVLLAALSVPAAAQQSTQPDTSKKTNPTGITTTTSPGAVEPTPAPTTPSPTNPSPTTTNPAPASMTPPTTAPSTGVVSTQPAPAGAVQIQPTSGTIKVDVKVDSSVANTVKISADSAFALARASNSAGEISSAELETTDNRLVYQVKMVKGAGASTVYVDALTGEVVKDKKFGGVKAMVENAEEKAKLDAKKDSTAKKP